MGSVLADYADRSDASGHRSRYRCRQARVRCDDADEKDRHRCNRGGAPRLRLQSSKRACLSIEVVPRPRSASRLAILPNTTHITLMERMPVIVPMVNDFFDAKPQKQ